MLQLGFLAATVRHGPVAAAGGFMLLLGLISVFAVGANIYSDNFSEDATKRKTQAEQDAKGAKVQRSYQEYLKEKQPEADAKCKGNEGKNVGIKGQIVVEPATFFKSAEYQEVGIVYYCRDGKALRGL